jgi:uncharacterized protein
MSTGIVKGDYTPRLADALVKRYLSLFGAVEVSGTKWCGKTWTSLAHAKSVTYVDKGANLQLASADPSYALAGDAPHVIDEWQRVPAIWDTVRHAVDESAGRKGLWLLTGSSAPRRDETAHSGAGRIGRVRMHPMTLFESGESSGAVSLHALFGDDFKPAPAPAAMSIEQLAECICRGGWPELVGTRSEDAQAVLGEYLQALYSQSIPALGGNEVIAQRLCGSLARNLSQAATVRTLARDVYAKEEEDNPSDRELREVSAHVGYFTRSYLVDEVPGWVPAARSPKRMRTNPKRYFADPSLAVARLGLSKAALMQDWQTFGLAFENLCMRDLTVYASVLPGVSGRPVRYYRDDSGLEVDAIVERTDGSWGAFEVKLSAIKADEGAKTLLRLAKKLGKDPQARTKPPSFLAVVVGMGEMAYRRPDGVYVIPVATLGA